MKAVVFEKWRKANTLSDLFSPGQFSSMEWKNLKWSDVHGGFGLLDEEQYANYLKFVGSRTSLGRFLQGESDERE